MKKVLVIGYLWPFRGGSGRTWGLAKYLGRLDWEPVVLTAPLNEKGELPCKVIETDYPGDIFSRWRHVLSHFGLNTRESISEQIKKRLGLTSERTLLDAFVNRYQEIFAYPDSEKRWEKPAVQAACRLLEQEKMDAMISVWPMTSHLIAKALKEKYHLPWIADFPDPWSQNHNYPYGRVRKYLDERLEWKTLLLADAMTAASPLYAKKQEAFHKRHVRMITNGFEPESLNVPQDLLSEKFTITYTGTIYPGKQDPEKLLAALSHLLNGKQIQREDVEVRFFGQSYQWFNRKIFEYGLEDVVKPCGILSRQESIKAQRASHLLLLLNWEDKNESGVYPLKFFEYLSARRPILAVGGFPGDDIEGFLTETKAGSYATTVEEIGDRIVDAYREYHRTKQVTYHGDLRKIMNYSYNAMARRFACLLDQITGK